MVSKRLPAIPKIKRLFWDIETSPNVVLAFRAGYDLTINHDAIIQERKIICIGYKWEGDQAVHLLTWDKNQNDKEMLRDFLLVANEADELVAHFGDRFDLPWFRTRCLLNGLEPIPAYKTVDTKAWASKHFYFNSNKLDYISDVLGHGKKLKTEFDLWKEILLHNCAKSLKYMGEYCMVDVRKLEKVYHSLAPYVKPKTHAGVLIGGDKWSCPRTGSTNVTKSKTRVSAAGTITHQMKAVDTGAYFSISDTAYKSYLNAKKK